jgi:hypothetical protein
MPERQWNTGVVDEVRAFDPDVGILTLHGW